MVNYRGIFKSMKSYFILIITVIFIAACNNDKKVDLSIIPEPNHIEMTDNGRFDVNKAKFIAIPDLKDNKSIFIAEQLVEFIKKELSIEIELVDHNSSNSADITLQLLPSSEQNEQESYQLVVNEKNISIAASDYSGLFYGTQSLKQLLFSAREQRTLESVVINDVPVKSYRGLMLDVSRHFFTVAEVKKVLDLMAFYKLNSFHWHLTDDQGWRIEIEQYPLLTTIGSYRNETIVDKNFDPFIGDGVPHFGYYTQDDIKEIVRYAEQRFITIIPEIDMPGHMQAALASYPDLACTEGSFQVSTRWGVHKDILCPSEYTFGFIENVLSEVMELFPGEYIHIGGDEVPTTVWKASDLAQTVMEENGLATEHELQGYFYQRVSSFLSKNGRKAIGWDEIQEKGLDEKTTIMAWRGLEQGELAVKNGHQVILNPTSHTYFNYYQANQNSEPLAQCCMITLEQAYQFDVELELLTTEQNELVLGGQGSLWTEYIKTQQHLEYMMLPRLFALSEVLWTNKENKNWSSFQNKLPQHIEYLESNEFNYRSITQ